MSIPILFGLNASEAAFELLRQKRIHVDRLKCAPTPSELDRGKSAGPVYVHFPLKVGLGIGDAVHAHNGKRVNWFRVEQLLRETDTPHVNLHLWPAPKDYPQIPLQTANPRDFDFLVEQTLRDVRQIVRRFGGDRVVVENDFDKGGTRLRPAYQPSFIRSIVQESKCGLLLDLSHARMAAHALEMKTPQYLAALPMDRLCEMHFNGAHIIEGRWIELLRRGKISEATIQHLAGKSLDHLPLAEADWELLEWSLAKIASGQWRSPWIATYEYGDFLALRVALTEIEVLATQTPRLAALIKRAR